MKLCSVEKNLSFKNKKGQIGEVFYALFFILIVGIILSIFSPVIDDFRVELINEYSPTSSENTLLLLVLYALMPILWIFYIILSVVLIILVVGASRGSPI